MKAGNDGESAAAFGNGIQENYMKPGLKTFVFLIMALLFGTTTQSFSLHTDTTAIEVGDTASIAIPFANMEGGVSPIEGARLDVAGLPAWIDIDTTTSYMGPTNIYPGESMTFNVAYRINSAYDPSAPVGAIIVSLLSDSTSFVPSRVTWDFTTDNGFKTMRGSCIDSDGIPCGSYVSPDALAPNTFLQFDGPSYETEAGKIFLSSNTWVYFVGADAYENNTTISRVAATGYSIAAAPSDFSGLNFSTIPVQLGAGPNVLYFASRDYAGNTGITQSTIVIVDAEPPSVGYEIVGPGGVAADGGVVVSTSSAIRLNSIDPGSGDTGSGPNRIMYALDAAYSSDTAWNYSEPLTLSSGAHALHYTAFDNVENQSAVKLLNIVVGNTNVSCGGTITEDTILAADMDCTGITGTVLNIGANGVTLDGNHHKIIAPDAAVVVNVSYKQGFTIRNIDLSGSGTGTGLQAYYLSAGRVENVTAHNRDIGINISRGDSNVIGQNDVSGNRISLQVGGSSVTVVGNNLGNSVTGLYAEAAQNLQISTSNNFQGSTTAISLAYSGNTTLDGFALHNPVGVNVSYCDNLTFRNLDLSGTKGTGLGAYYLSNSLITDVVAHGRDIGVSLGRGGSNVISDNELSDNVTALQIGGSTITVSGNNLGNSSRALYAEDAHNISIAASNGFSGSTTAITLAYSSDIELVGLTLDNHVGISAAYSKNIRIRDMDLSGTGGTGVGTYYLSDSSIENIIAHGRNNGIVIDRGERNVISGNDLSGSRTALQIGGSSITVEGNKLGQSDIGLSATAAYFVVIGPSNDFGGAKTGISFMWSGDSLIDGVTLGNNVGLYSYSNANMTFRNINLAVPGVRAGTGMIFNSLRNSVISGALVAGRDVGLKLEGACDGVALMNATVANNNTGLSVSPPCSGAAVINSLLWGNTDDVQDQSGLTLFRFSNIQEKLYAGEGNIQEDPLFRDAAAGDFTPGEGSPCIDVGTNAVAGVAAVDLAGNPRVHDGDGDDISVVDMGAYENQRSFLPVITMIYPSSGSVSTAFTLSGNFFGGYSSSTSKVLIGAASAPVSDWASGAIHATVPGDLAPGVYPVVVQKESSGILVRSSTATFEVLPTVSSSEDGMVSITASDEPFAVTAISTSAIPSTSTVFAAMSALGLAPVMAAFYDFEPSGIYFASPATISFTFDPSELDGDTAVICYFDGVTWSTETVANQRVTYGPDGLATVSGEIAHTSIYALLRVNTAPQVSLGLEPDTLNLKSKGEVVTASLRMSPGSSGCFDRASLKISAINGQALASPIPGQVRGGAAVECEGTSVKFSRGALAEVLPPNAQVKVAVSGALSDGRPFSAEDLIRTIKPVLWHDAGKFYVPAEADFKLGLVYVSPNPVTGGRAPVFHIETGSADSVKLRIFTAAGQPVHETTLAGEPRVVGSSLAYEYAWQGRIPGGVYYYTVEAERGGKKLMANGTFSVMR